MENNIFLDEEQNKLLQKQQVTQDKINSLLENSLSSLSCGPTCQKIKTTEELKQLYLAAEKNLKLAPIELEKTKQNYYVYAEGDVYYNSMKEKELKEFIEKESASLNDAFNEDISKAIAMNDYYNMALNNSVEIEEYLNSIIQKNEELLSILKKNRGDILTNDRKTYYEKTALNQLQWWYNLLWYVFYFLAFVFIISTILVPSKTSFTINIIIFILIFTYPYYINYIVKWIYGLYKKINYIF